MMLGFAGMVQQLGLVPSAFVRFSLWAWPCRLTPFYHLKKDYCTVYG
ncbi:hypothetical protein ACNJNY_21095 [Citrobacter freundii]